MRPIFFFSVVLFTHRSAFPVFFNAAVTDQWWRLALTFRVFRRESGQRVVSVLRLIYRVRFGHMQPPLGHAYDTKKLV